LLDDSRVLADREDEADGFIEAVSNLFAAEPISVRPPDYRRPQKSASNRCRG
jgi:hypothetical protein